MCGLSGSCYCIKSLLLLGSNLSDQDDLAERMEPILLSPSERAGDLANIPYLIQLRPNGHEDALVRSLELVHRLVGLYL